MGRSGRLRARDAACLRQAEPGTTPPEVRPVHRSHIRRRKTLSKILGANAIIAGPIKGLALLSMAAGGERWVPHHSAKICLLMLKIEHRDCGCSVVLEESIDADYEPTPSEVEEYSLWLGMELPRCAAVVTNMRFKYGSPASLSLSTCAYCLL
eukprot:SAG31_NODE_566_length_14037_cov_32.372148_3_plen_153_part_00